jgi:hypothetical protein
LASEFFLVAIAGEHWEARILGKARINEGELAKDEDRAVSRFDAAGMKAIRAKTGVQRTTRVLLLRIRHDNKNSVV